MDDLTSKLESLIKEMSETIEILSKKNGNDFSLNHLYKKVEDGIFDNIHKATDYQMKQMMSYKFRYYTEFNFNKELLKSHIKGIIRDKKIDSIL